MFQMNELKTKITKQNNKTKLNFCEVVEITKYLTI